MFRKRNRSAGLVKIRWRPEHFCASVEKAAKRWAGLLAKRTRRSHHSGATARDSHPLPYSPLTWGTQTLIRKIRSLETCGHYHARATRVKR
jgi:hypothetical protein